MTRALKLLALATTLAISPACGSSNKSTSQSSGSGSGTGTGAGSGTAGGALGFLTSTDIASPPTVLSQDAATAVAELTSNSALYDNQPANSTDNCVSTALDSLSPQSTDTLYELNKSIDLTSCVQSLSPPSGGTTIDVLKSTMQIFFYVSCPQGGLAKLAGQKLSAISNPEAACQGTATEIAETKLVSTSNYSGSAGSGTIVQTSISWQSKSDLTPATVSVSGSVATTAAGWTSGSLETTVQTVTGAAATTTNDYVLITLQNSETVANDTTTVFPSAGLMSVQVNAWQGTVAFNADAPPTYELTSSAGGSPTTGMITPQSVDGSGSTSLNLRQPQPGLGVPKIHLPRFGRHGVPGR